MPNHLTEAQLKEVISAMEANGSPEEEMATVINYYAQNNSEEQTPTENNEKVDVTKQSPDSFIKKVSKGVETLTDVVSSNPVITAVKTAEFVIGKAGEHKALENSITEEPTKLLTKDQIEKGEDVLILQDTFSESFNEDEATNNVNSAFDFLLNNKEADLKSERDAKLREIKRKENEYKGLITRDVLFGQQMMGPGVTTSPQTDDIADEQARQRRIKLQEFKEQEQNVNDEYNKKISEVNKSDAQKYYNQAKNELKDLEGATEEDYINRAKELMLQDKKRKHYEKMFDENAGNPGFYQFSEAQNLVADGAAWAKQISNEDIKNEKLNERYINGYFT